MFCIVEKNFILITVAPPPIAARPHNMSLNSSNSKGMYKTYT